MTTEEKRSQLNELKKIATELKSKRDFAGLIAVINDSLPFVETVGTVEDMVYAIGQKAYCYARLGKAKDAEETLTSLGIYQLFLKDTLFRIFTLVSLFTTIKDSEIRSNLILRNTIKKWLEDPDASKDVSRIVFDYEDIVGNLKPFDSSRLNNKQTFFSEKLIECIFSAMQRDSDAKIYYNKENNDVQQEVQGYLSSHMADDQSIENRRLANRIMNFDTGDNVIKGIHYLVPRLTLRKFLTTFSECSSNYRELLEFTTEFENAILKEYSEYVSSIDDLAFSEGVSGSFYRRLDKWYKETHFNVDKLKGALNNTITKIAVEYLDEVNAY